MHDIKIKRSDSATWDVILPDGSVAIQFSGNCGESGANAWVDGYKKGWLDKDHLTKARMMRAFKQLERSDRAASG